MAPVRLDALENYIRGNVGYYVGRKVQHYREAVRLDPEDAQPGWKQARLTTRSGLTTRRSPLLSQVQQIPALSGSRSGAVAREANPISGSPLRSRRLREIRRRFAFVAARLPLAEVYNNLGAVTTRRGQKKAADYFESDSERSQRS